MDADCSISLPTMSSPADEDTSDIRIPVMMTSKGVFEALRGITSRGAGRRVMVRMSWDLPVLSQNVVPWQLWSTCLLYTSPSPRDRG